MRQRRLLAVGSSNRQPGTISPFVGRPDANRQVFFATDLGHGLLEHGKLLGGQIDANHHGEDVLFIAVVHLDFGDVTSFAGDIMNDRVGETAIIGTNGSDDDSHE